MIKNKVLLAILDGWGIGQNPKVDAIAQADTPCYDRLIKQYPSANLITFGSDVGLPDGQMGNSEVGHLNIGAGRVVYQELARINKAISEQTLLKERVIKEALSKAKELNKPVHFIGLVSDGGVHAHIDHLISLVNGFSAEGVDDIRIHAFLDGRDTSPDGGADYLSRLVAETSESHAKVASVIGRYYAMDRDLRWDRVKKAYDLLVKGIGKQVVDPILEVRNYYEQGITDEFMEPIISDPELRIKDGDIVFFINFRTDRPRELTTVLTQESMPDHDMHKLDLHFLTMTEYNQAFKGLKVVFKKDLLPNTIGKVIEDHGGTQVRIAETEKYPHVTYFFNGGREEPFNGEERILIQSPQVATYDLQPEMSAKEITEAIVQSVEHNTPDFICLNYANADMVGHTGDFMAAQKAVETVDQQLNILVEKALAKEYHIIVIADHGNSDYMINDDGSPHTAHTTNLVPIMYISPSQHAAKLSNGRLADIATTILSIMKIQIPKEMTGINLIG